MDVSKLIECLDVGDLKGAMNFAPKFYHETLDLQRLMPMGWKYYGTGFYSLAIGKIDSDRVWKISWHGRDQWVHYAQYVVSQPADSNPLLPKIYQLEIQDDRGIAWMERLNESGIYHSVGMRDVIKLCKTRSFSNRFGTIKSKRRKIKEYLTKLFDMRGNRNYNLNNLADIVVWIAGLNDAKVDCHGRNWMARPTGQLVLTDPIG